MEPLDPLRFVPEARRGLLAQYSVLLKEHNTRVNLVSRASVHTVDSLHIPHCLSIASRIFPAGSTVVDWGTGGGLPAIPLAIAFPDVAFVGIDSTGKKVRAVQEMAAALGLRNVTAVHTRAEEWIGPADFAVSRATAPIDVLWKWTSRVLSTRRQNPLAGGKPAISSSAGGLETRATERPSWAPGLICLKGGDLTAEIKALPLSLSARLESVESLIGEGFAGKYIVHVSGAINPKRSGS